MVNTTKVLICCLHTQQFEKMNPNESEDWQLSLDVDDSDLFLTSTKRTINNQEARVENTSSQKNVSNKSFVVQKNDSQPVRIIPGPAGIVQSAKLLKTQLIQDGVEDSQTPTQAFIMKADEQLDPNECFTRGPWVGAVDYVHNNGGIVYGCLGNIDKFMKKGKLEQVIAIVMSVSPNAIGDLTVTLKDPTGSVSGAIHHKVINDEGVMEGNILPRGQLWYLLMFQFLLQKCLCITLTLLKET